MSTLPRYCSHCGAANAAESQLCFACQRPLDTQEGEQERLLNDRYRLLTQVGSGGFGGVYRAIDTAEAPRIIAVKQINLRGLSTQEVIEATDGFNRELRLLSALNHPNLPKIHDTFTDPEHWYLVMDFIEGETLEEYLKQKASYGLPLREALEIGLQLCTVLNYLHTREPAIIFRDLKPSNVMRSTNGQIYLIDFGIARLFSPGKPKDTTPFGSPGYAAPEQYGRAQTTPQADIYSLGALLHHLLTGNDPAESPFRFAPLPMADSAQLAELDTLIQRMVATEPGERPASVAEVKAVLQRLAEQVRRERELASFDLPGQWRPPTQVPTLPARTTRRKVLTTALAFGGAAVGIAGMVGLCEIAAHPRYSGVQGTIALPPPSPGATKQQFVYTGHKGPITALSWSPDGTMVASGSADKTIQVWRASDGALLYTLSGYDLPVTSVVWATNEKNIIASGGQSDGTVPVWDALRDHRYLIFHGDGRVLALAWQPASPWIASGGTDRDIYIWNAETGAKGPSYRGHKGDVRALAWVPDGQTRGNTESGLVASGGADGTVQIWNAADAQHVYTYTGHTAGVNSIAMLQYNANQPVDAIASASDDGTVQVWRLATANAETTYREHHGKVNAVASVPAVPYYGPLVASAGDDQTVQIWPRYGYRLLTYSQHQAPVKALATSPVDRRVVSGDENGQVHLWTIAGMNR